MDTYFNIYQCAPLNIKSLFLTEIESIQLNQFIKHKTKDYYVPVARKYAGIKKK